MGDQHHLISFVGLASFRSGSDRAVIEKLWGLPGICMGRDGVGMGYNIESLTDIGTVSFTHELVSHRIESEKKTKADFQ